MQLIQDPWVLASPATATGGRRSTRGKRGGSRANDHPLWSWAARTPDFGGRRSTRGKRGGSKNADQAAFYSVSNDMQWK